MMIFSYDSMGKKPQHEKCPNTEFFLVRIQVNTDQKKLPIWTLFTKWTLNAFIKSLNEFDSTIKLTVDNSEKSTEFLDVTINIKNGVLKTGLFVTPTNTHQYLESYSCHPYHCKKGILYSQALWLSKMYKHFFFWQEM